MDKTYIFFWIMAIALIMVGCAGEEGPEGPAGPEGPIVPIINSIVADPFILSPGDTSQITASITYLGTGTLSYQWSATGGIITGDDTSATWIAPNEEDTYTIKLEINNGENTVIGMVNVSVQTAASQVTILDIMEGANFFQEIILPNLSLSFSSILLNSNYNATMEGDFLVYSKSVQTFWQDFPDLSMKIAIDSSGNYYGGCYGDLEESLSLLCVPCWGWCHCFGFFEAENYTTGLFHIMAMEHSTWLDSGYVSSGPPTFGYGSGSTYSRTPERVEWYSYSNRISNQTSSDIHLIHSAVSVNDPLTYPQMDPWFLQINDRWWPYSSGNDDGSATRTFSLNYSGETLSYIIGLTGHDSNNGASLSLDGIVVAEHSGYVGHVDYSNFGVYPIIIEMYCNKNWSVAVSSFSMALIANDVQVIDHSVNPDGGPISNPLPLIWTLVPGWN